MREAKDLHSFIKCFLPRASWRKTETTQKRRVNVGLFTYTILSSGKPTICLDSSPSEPKQKTKRQLRKLIYFIAAAKEALYCECQPEPS